MSPGPRCDGARDPVDVRQLLADPVDEPLEALAGAALLEEPFVDPFAEAAPLEEEPEPFVDAAAAGSEEPDPFVPPLERPFPEESLRLSVR